MGKNKGLDPEQSIRAITLIKDAGWTPGRVGKHLGVSRNAIRNIVKRLQETGTVVRRSGMGKRGKIQESDYQLLMEIVEHGRYKNTNELTDLLNQELGLNISRTTYRRTIERLKPLMKSGLQSNGLQQEPQDHFILSGNSFVHESSDETLSDSDDEHDYSEIIKTFREHAEESFQMFKG
jgi:transposase